MTKITVNRAIKYRNLLATAISNTTITTTGAIRYESIEQLDAEHEALSAKAQKELQNKLEDINALFALRLLIDRANSKGSGEFLNGVAMLEEHIKVLHSVAVSGGRSNTKQQIADAFNLKLKLEKVEPSRVVGVQNAAANLFSEEQLEEIRETISELKREIEDLREKRNALNLEVQVVLPDDVIVSLKRHKII